MIVLGGSDEDGVASGEAIYREGGAGANNEDTSASPFTALEGL